MSTAAALSVKVSANISDFQSKMSSVEKSFSSVGGRMTSIGSALTKGITVPLGAIAALAGKAAINFESSFAGVRKTVDATEVEFAKMAQGFRDLAKTMPVSVDELNRIGEAAGQLGISKEHIVDFSRTMAMLGATTNVTSDQAATGIAQIQNIFNASGKATQNFGSTLVALGNAGASTEAEILELTTRLAGAANQIGMTQAQTLGFASAMANLGINAEAGGTAMSTVFSKMSVAADMGGKALKNFATIASMDTGAFASLFKTDSAEAITRFIEGLGKVKTEGGNLTSVLSTLGLSSIRVSDTLKRMAGNTDNLRSSLSLATKSWTENTALTEEYRKRAETTASQLQILWNRINDVAITLGTAMLPTVKVAVTAMGPLLSLASGMADRFAGLPVPLQATALGFGAIAAAAGPLIFIIGTLITSWGKLAAAIGIAGKVGPAAWAAMTNPFVLFVVGVGAATVAISKLIDAWQRAVDTVQTRGWGRGGLLSMLGENVNNPEWSLFQGPSRKRGGFAPGSTPRISPGFLAGGAAAARAAQELADAQSGLSPDLSALSGGKKSDTEKQAERVANAVKSAFGGKEAVAIADAWLKKVQEIGGASNLTAQQTKKFSDALWDSVEAMKLGGTDKQFTAKLQQWAALQKAEFSTGLVKQKDRFGITQDIPTGTSIITTLSDATLLSARMKALTEETMGHWEKGPQLILQPLEMAALSGQTLRDNAKAIRDYFAAVPSLMDKMFGGTAGIGQTFGNALVAGLLSAGSRMKAFMTTLAKGFGDTIGDFLSKSLEKAMGAATGFFSKGIGKMLGGLLSSFAPLIGDLLGGLMSKLFGPTEYEKRVRSEAEERKQIAATTDMATLQQQAAFTGRGDLLAQFLAVKDTAQPEYLRGLVAELEERTNRLNAAMERYGISWEMLGEKAKQSQIDQMAIQFIQDFEVLSQAGMDVNLIIEKMSGKVNEFVQAAIRTGTEVPIAMQPMLQKMLEMGLLTDEAGNQLTDLTSIQFSQTMTQGFQAVVEAINHLTKALGYDIPNAANMAANGMNEAFARVKGPEIPGMSREDWETWGRSGGNPPDAFTPHGDFPAMAAGGIVRRPTVALIGEAGPEAVVPLRGTGGMGTTVILEVDGRTMAQVVVPHIPGEVQRYGLA